MDNQNTNYLIKFKSVFRNKLTLWFSVVSLCIPLLGLVFIFYDLFLSSHNFYNFNADTTFFNIVLTVGSLISFFPAMMWAVVYKKSSENYGAESLIKPFKILEKFSAVAIALYCVGFIFSFVTIISFVLLCIVFAIGYTSPFLFITALFTIGMVFILLYYFLKSFSFLRNICEGMINPETSYKKGKRFFGYNIFLAVIFIILAVDRLLCGLELTSLFVNFFDITENMLLFVIFGIFAVKHILEGLIAKNYFKQKETFDITDDIPEVADGNLYETLENL